MDIKKYISSGILEQYVLGFVTEAERLEVEKYVQEYPEIRKELDAIEVALEQYAKMHSLPTPQGVDIKYNERIDKLIAQNPKLNNPNKKSGGFWLPIFLIGALLATGWWAFSNYKNYQSSESQLSMVTNQLNTLQENCDETNQKNEELKSRLQILQESSNQTVKISKTGTEEFASIIWNPQTRKSYLFNTSKLAPPPTGKQYQLWAIVDGAPVDMKPIVLSADSEILIEVDFIENPSAFAISLEDEGGSPTPTDVVAIGTLTG